MLGRFNDALTHWTTASLIHWLIASSNRWFIDSLIPWSSDFLLHWFTDSLLRWFVGSPDRSITASLIHWLGASLFVTSLFHWLLIVFFIGSSVHCVIASFIQLCSDSFISCHWHLNRHLLIRWCTSQLQHFIASASQKLSYRPLISYSYVLFLEVPPLRVPGTTWYTPTTFKNGRFYRTSNDEPVESRAMLRGFVRVFVFFHWDDGPGPYPLHLGTHSRRVVTISVLESWLCWWMCNEINSNK